MFNMVHWLTQLTCDEYSCVNSSPIDLSIYSWASFNNQRNIRIFFISCLHMKVIFALFDVFFN